MVDEGRAVGIVYMESRKVNSSLAWVVRLYEIQGDLANWI